MSRFNIGSGIFGLMLVLCSFQTQATSFDCTKAASFSEKTICADASLSRLDEKLNSAYVRALDRAPDSDKVRVDQREWLRLRDNCTTRTCLSASLSSRVQALSEVVQPPVGPPPAFDIKRVEQAMASRVPAQATSSAKVDVPSGSLASKKAQDDHQAVLYFKIALFCMGLLLVICLWLHSRGSMTIYLDYTDALWTSLTPVLGIGSYLVFSWWLEIPKNYSVIAACVLTGLMSVQIIIQTYRSNGISPFFLLSLFAKFALLTFYLLMMALLLSGGGRTKSDARRRRGWAVVVTTVFVFLSGWMCRNRQFSSIDDYIAGRA